MESIEEIAGLVEEINAARVVCDVAQSIVESSDPVREDAKQTVEFCKSLISMNIDSLEGLL